MKAMKLIKLYLNINFIIIGERVKGGIYRPCLETIPSSTVRGAFKYSLGIDVCGAGFFEPGTYEIRDFTYSVRDKCLETSKIPLTTSYLCAKKNNKIRVIIYIAKDNSLTVDKFHNLSLTIGALKSKGFGKSKVIKVEEIESEIKQGFLKIRVLEDDAPKLGITVLSPVYSYLFYSSNLISGVYKRALFEDSLVRAPEVFLREVTFYDE